MKRILFMFLFNVVILNNLVGQQIRSIMINPTGTDSPLEFFEISGTPGQNLDGLCLLEIDGDTPGIINQKISLNGQVIGSNGLFLWRASTSVLTTSTPANSTSINTVDFSPDLQNGTGTFLLMECPNQVVGNDIDDLNDGTPNIDLTNGGTFSILDAVSITDGDVADIQYGSYFSGTNLPLKPSTSIVAEYVFRDGGTFYASVLQNVGGFLQISSVSNSAWNSGGGTSVYNGLQLANGTSAASVFPVTLTNFTGKNKPTSISLNWSTTSETNFSHFVVQKSKDAKGFESIGRIESAGFDSEKSEYSFIDEKPFSGNNYYRLKMVDKDGTEDYSKMISVNFDGKALAVFYPNPTQDFVRFENIKTEDINSVSVHKINGEYLGETHPTTDGIDISGFKSRELILQLKMKNNQTITSRIIKNL